MQRAPDNLPAHAICTYTCSEEFNAGDTVKFSINLPLPLAPAVIKYIRHTISLRRKVYCIKICEDDFVSAFKVQL